MYMCARFHEIPAKGLQDIKETKCYGWTDGRTDNVKTVYPPYNFVIAGGIINAFYVIRLYMLLQYLFLHASLTHIPGFKLKH